MRWIQLCAMVRTKQVIPAMRDNIWRILEKARVPMQPFSTYHDPKQYIRKLPDIEEEASEAEVARAPQIPHPKMPAKVDKPVALVLVIPMGSPIPP